LPSSSPSSSSSRPPPLPTSARPPCYGLTTESAPQIHVLPVSARAPHFQVPRDCCSKRSRRHYRASPATEAVPRGRGSSPAPSLRDLADVQLKGHHRPLPVVPPWRPLVQQQPSRPTPAPCSTPPPIPRWPQRRPSWLRVWHHRPRTPGDKPFDSLALAPHSQQRPCTGPEAWFPQSQQGPRPTGPLHYSGAWFLQSQQGPCTGPEAWFPQSQQGQQAAAPLHYSVAWFYQSQQGPCAAPEPGSPKAAGPAAGEAETATQPD